MPSASIAPIQTVSPIGTAPPKGAARFMSSAAASRSRIRRAPSMAAGSSRRCAEIRDQGDCAPRRRRFVASISHPMPHARSSSGPWTCSHARWRRIISEARPCVGGGEL